MSLRHIRFHGAEGNALAASSWGEGPRCALLLHGGGQTRHAWDKTGRQLAALGWRAVAVDQRGHGESAWVPSRRYSFGDYAADAALLGRALTEESGRAPVAIGASLGGIAALSSFALGPPAFAGLALVDVVPKMDAEGVAHIQGFMRARAREGFASVEEAADAIAAYLPHRPRPRSLAGLAKNLRRHADGRWRWHWDPAFLDGPCPVHHGWDALEPRVEAAARALPVPLLLVRGGSSELVPAGEARAFVDSTPDGALVDIAEARHMVAGDRNDAFGAAIAGFLQRRFPPGGE